MAQLLFAVLALLLVSAFAVPQCTDNEGKKRNDGEEWTKDKYISGCKISKNGSWKVSVVACITPGGKTLRGGQKATEGKVEYNCETTPNGSGILKTG